MFTSVCAKPKVMPDEPWRGEDSCSKQSGPACLSQAACRAGVGVTVLVVVFVQSLVCWGPVVWVGLEPSAASTCVSESRGSPPVAEGVWAPRPKCVAPWPAALGQAFASLLCVVFTRPSQLYTGVSHIFSIIGELN